MQELVFKDFANHHAMVGTQVIYWAWLGTCYKFLKIKFTQYMARDPLKVEGYRWNGNNE